MRHGRAQLNPKTLHAATLVVQVYRPLAWGDIEQRDLRIVVPIDIILTNGYGLPNLQVAQNLNGSIRRHSVVARDEEGVVGIATFDTRLKSMSQPRNASTRLSPMWTTSLRRRPCHCGSRATRSLASLSTTL
eukprot:6365341-Prymnesium_polylepis.5